MEHLRQGTSPVMPSRPPTTRCIISPVGIDSTYRGAANSAPDLLLISQQKQAQPIIRPHYQTYTRAVATGHLAGTSLSRLTFVVLEVYVLVVVVHYEYLCVPPERETWRAPAQKKQGNRRHRAVLSVPAAGAHAGNAWCHGLLLCPFRGRAWLSAFFSISLSAALRLIPSSFRADS